MFAALLVLFLAVVAADALLSAAVIYHLRQYTLPGWTAAKLVIPLYLILASLLLIVALAYFLRVPWADYPTPREFLSTAAP
ncbi:MAG: hypothetical protein AAB844_00820 [Patescibacteria group bacterium]|mgnify:CR=1 FL=1